MNSIRLKFLGAIGYVTGSCTLIEFNKTNYYLVDAGLYQNESNPEIEENRGKILKKYAKKIEFIFLTHAHLDHIGILPELIEWEFAGQVCGTKATIELTKIMLEDLIRINKHHDPKIIEKIKFYPLDENQGRDTFNGFGRKYFPLNKNLRVTILRTSHILGSCSYLFCYTEEEMENFDNKEKIKYLYFTGDIGPVTDDFKPNILFKEHQIPFDNEYKTIIMESTYGGKSRGKKPYTEKIEKLSDIIQTAIENGKTVIIPAFALDRAQQILVDLQYIISAYYKKKNTDFYDTIAKYKEDNKGNYITGVFDYIPTEEFDKKVNSKIRKDVKSLFGDKSDLFSKFPPEIQEKIKSISKDIKIGINSPLIGKINKVYQNHLNEEFFSSAKEKMKRSYKYLSDGFLREFEIKGESVSPEQKDAIRNKLKSCFNKSDDIGNIIVSASGMCDEGAVLYLLKKYLQDENAIIMLTGYQANNTNGYLLKNYSEGNFDKNNLEEKISLNNIDIKLADTKCEIVDMSEYYSGHADQEQLINYVTNSQYNKNLTKTTVFLNHGQNDARNKLKKAIDEKGNEKITVLLPQLNRWYDLITGEEEDSSELEFEEMENTYKSEHCRSINIDGIHMFVPLEYNEDKLKKIIEYINNY
jgi:metallo-beta-lactamase family protein